MSDLHGTLDHHDLEARLADLATVLALPPTPDLARAVGSRLRAAAGPVEAPEGAVGARPRPQPIRRSLLRSLLLAAALALLVVGGAFAVRFGLELLSIEFGPVPTAAPPSPGAQPSGPTGLGLGLGRPVTLDEARAAAPFDVRLPAALGQPDALYLGGPSLRGQVAFVYRPRDDLPASSLLGGAGLLVTQNRGEPDHGLARKLADSGQATVQPVDVAGAPGVWITGRPHVFWYLAPDGQPIEDSRRYVGDTLAWERDGILYRIEGAVTLSRALEIARSMP